MKWIFIVCLFISQACFGQKVNGININGGQSFNPKNVSGLTAWWRADYGLTLDTTTTTNTISKALDLSGNTNNLSQGTKANQPFIITNNINGYPVFLFTGQRRLLCDSIASLANGTNTAHSIFIVSNSDAVDANSPILGWGNNTNNTPIVTVRGPANGSPNFTLRYTRNDDSSSGTAPTLVGLTSNAWHIAGVSFNGTNATLFMDNSISTTPANVGNITINVFTIGMKHGATFTNPWAGRLAEILIYNTNLSTNDIGNVKAYLNSKYKIF